MAVVITLVPSRRPARRTDAPPSDGARPPAQILFFTGVRYERQTEAGEPALAAAKTVRRRTGRAPLRKKV